MNIKGGRWVYQIPEGAQDYEYKRREVSVSDTRRGSGL